MLKTQIQQGEQMLAEYVSILEKIKTIKEVKDDKAMLEFLLEIQRLEFEGRTLGLKTRLAQLKNDYAIQFERNSAECNMSIDKLIAEGMGFVGKEPIYITEKIRTLIAAWDIDLEQEAKNDIYFELKDHVEFLNKDYKHGK